MHTEFLARQIRPRIARTQPVILGLSLFALSAFTTADVLSAAHQPSQCEALYSEVSERPSDVLVGTDVADLSSFKESDAELSGEYSAELGGATVTVSVTPNALTRTFQEPGTDPDQRTFQPVCRSGSELIADGMIARRVSEGLLYLEPSSDVGGIPADLWMLLDAQ